MQHLLVMLNHIGYYIAIKLYHQYNNNVWLSMSPYKYNINHYIEINRCLKEAILISSGKGEHQDDVCSYNKL